MYRTALGVIHERVNTDFDSTRDVTITKPTLVMNIVLKERLEVDIAIIDVCPAVKIPVHGLCKTLRTRSDDRYRWLLFVFGANRTELFVSRAGLAAVLTTCIEDGEPDLDMAELPRDETFMMGLKEPAKREEQPGNWWTDQPTKAHSFDMYTRAGAEFMADLCSAVPLARGANLRGGLWIVLRGLAAHGKRCEINDILYRFHCALLYDLRHGAHRFSSVLDRAFERLPNFHKLSTATASSTISAIDEERPVATQALQTMFPTDTQFGAMPIECLGLVSRLMPAKSLLIQAGWIMAPLRLLRPHVLAARTVMTLRRVCADWLRQRTLAKVDPTGSTAVAAAAERGVKRLFQEPIMREIMPTAMDAMYTSIRSGAPAGAVPPPCVLRYIEWSECGEPGGKLAFEARWPVLRTLRHLGMAQSEIERIYLSPAGLRRWYAAADREGELRRRKRDLLAMFGKKGATSDGKRTSCVDFFAFGLCPFVGDDSDRVRACCSARTAIKYHDGWEPRDSRGRPVHTPVQVAGLRHRKSGREYVAVEVDGGMPVAAANASSSSTSSNPRMRFVTTPPARIPFSKLAAFQ